MVEVIKFLSAARPNADKSSPCLLQSFFHNALYRDQSIRLESKNKVFGRICMFVFQISVGSKDMP